MAYKILITGAEGQLGQSLYNTLNKQFNVRATSRNGNNRLNIDKLDITDIDMVKSTLQSYEPNIIINSAAITDVDFCESNKAKSRRVNVAGLENMVKSSHLNTKIIHFSSDFIFDGLKRDYTEKSRPNPINYYGKNKLEAENILIGSKRTYLILRISTVFSNLGNNFFNWVYSNLQDNKKIYVACDQLINPTYTYFLSLALVDMILLEGNGIYNYGSKDCISKFDFSKLIARKFDFNEDLICKVKTKDITSFVASRPLNCSLDCNNIQNSFDLKLPYVNESIEHLKNMYYE